MTPDSFCFIHTPSKMEPPWWSDPARTASILSQLRVGGSSLSFASVDEVAPPPPPPPSSSNRPQNTAANHANAVKEAVTSLKRKHVDDRIKDIRRTLRAVQTSPECAVGTQHPLTKSWAEWLDATYHESPSHHPPDLELVSRVHEESYLRPPRTPDERPCSSGDACEGAEIVRGKILLDTPPLASPLPLVAFQTPDQLAGRRPQWEHGLCLLCIRRRITEEWMMAAIQERPVARVTQPYRVGDDYPTRVLIPKVSPVSADFYGISDGFVRHVRAELRWVDDGEFAHRHGSGFDGASSAGHGLGSLFGIDVVPRWQFDLLVDEEWEAEKNPDWATPPENVSSSSSSSLGMKALVGSFGAEAVREAVRVVRARRRCPVRLDLFRALFGKPTTPAERLVAESAPHKAAPALERKKKGEGGLVEEGEGEWEGEEEEKRLSTKKIRAIVPDATMRTFVRQATEMFPDSTKYAAVRLFVLWSASLDGPLLECLHRIYGETALKKYTDQLSCGDGSFTRVTKPRVWFWTELFAMTRTALRRDQRIPLFDARYVYESVDKTLEAARAAGCSAEAIEAIKNARECSTALQAKKAICPKLEAEVAGIALVVRDTVSARMIQMPIHWYRAVPPREKECVFCPICLKFKNQLVQSRGEWLRRWSAKRDEILKQRMGCSMAACIRDLRVKSTNLGASGVAYDPHHDVSLCFPKRRTEARLESANFDVDAAFADDDMDHDYDVKADDEEGEGHDPVEDEDDEEFQEFKAKLEAKAERRLKPKEFRRNAMDYTVCEQTPCLSVDLRGHVLKLGKQYIASCWGCGLPCDIQNHDVTTEMLCTICAYERSSAYDQFSDVKAVGACLICRATPSRKTKGGAESNPTKKAVELSGVKVLDQSGFWTAGLCGAHRPPFIHQHRVWYWPFFERCLFEWMRKKR